MQIACPRCRTVLDYSNLHPAFCFRCGCALTPPALGPTEAFDPEATKPYPPPTAGQFDSPPEVVGGYRLLRPLGSGGMGTVYEAEDPASGRRVALKLISAAYVGSTEAAERFRREGRLASTLVHPRCVFVFAADEEAGRPYLVMELMPGRTLEDLVSQEGPLGPARAVTKILDVLDGLQEAHRLGFIHRDVKPSNCFLDAEGRVKIGDFGLAKSLIQITNLTQTGSFLGTPLFAAPEQIKGEPVDVQSDVYAVSATLYFLLTGQAPFAGGDATSTLARIVSEPAPSLRSRRPDLDPALDAVVLRGLERDRAKRWRSLAEFRAALLAVRPGSARLATLGPRFAAYLLDSLILALVNNLLWSLLLPMIWLPAASSAGTTLRLDAIALLSAAVVCFYFALLEGFWGASLGKRLLGLRVRKASSPASQPRLPRILLRTILFVGLMDLGALTQAALWLVYPISVTDVSNWAVIVRTIFLLLLFLLPFAGWIAGMAILLAPMRARNGYRGLHEWPSDTRVVRLPRREKRRGLLGRVLDRPLRQPEELPEALGPFRIRGALRWDEDGKILLGQDPNLGRAVWIWLRPAAEAPLTATRRDISRATRLRWLACGRHSNVQWDAFMAFLGCPLAEAVPSRGETWARLRPLLEELAEELTAACAENTLPDLLHADQVWVGPDGQVHLLDIPVGRSDAAEGAGGPSRALTLLGQSAVLVLEGRPRPTGSNGPIRAPLPHYAGRLLNALLGNGEPYQDVDEFRANLKARADQPAEVSRHRRAAHLGMLAALLFAGLICMFPAGWVNQMFPFGNLARTIQEKEERIRELEEGALLEFSTRAVNPDPLLRLHAAAQLESDYQLRDRLRQSLDLDQRRLAAQLASRGWLSRIMLEGMKEQIDADWNRSESVELRNHAKNSGNSFRRRATHIPVREGPPAGVLLVSLIAWPALWIAWAFLARGGFSYRLAGIALVRGDGRPAARLQCAWRAFLVWAPVTGLLVLSFWLEMRYWEEWELGKAPRWLLALASASWDAALLLLAAYVFLALWRPARTLHDRLSGTYLVPR